MESIIGKMCFRESHKHFGERYRRESSSEKYQRDNERNPGYGKDADRRDFGRNSDNARDNYRWGSRNYSDDRRNNRTDSDSRSQENFHKGSGRNFENRAQEFGNYNRNQSDSSGTQLKDCSSEGDKKCIEVKMSIPKDLCGAIVGHQGSVKRRIEVETNTQIFVPFREQSGMTIIKGPDPSTVLSAKNRIELLIRSERAKRRATHFINIPLVNLEIKEKYLEFRKNVLETCGEDRGVNDAHFTFPDKLHLTLGVLVLLNEDDRNKAKHVLDKCAKEVINPIVSENPLVIRMKGIEYMNDDPAEVDTLYGKVKPEDDSDWLQCLADQIRDFFSSEDQLTQSARQVKLHATLMKSRRPVLQDSRFSSNKREDRITFDARNILKLFADFDFGTSTISSVHLSEVFSKSENNYYFCTAKIDLAQPI